jgi:heme o synthase
MEIRLQTSTWQDYLSLTKPRTVLLHLITAAAAMFLASSGWPLISTLGWTLLGGGMLAGASNALNCYFDRNLDKTMERTRRRPLPDGRIDPGLALNFSAILAISGLYILQNFVSWKVALLALAALAYYVPLYTLVLKRHTSWSAVLGSGAGAFPPLIGWVAVNGRIELTPFLLFALVALWSPPHFWALAVYRRREFRRAGLGPMPSGNIANWTMVFSILLIAVSLLCLPLAGLGLVYLAAAAVLGAGFLILSGQLYRKDNRRAAYYLHRYSIIYLMALFTAISMDKLIIK